jgi:hypothetical protein
VLQQPGRPSSPAAGRLAGQHHPGLGPLAARANPFIEPALADCLSGSPWPDRTPHRRAPVAIALLGSSPALEGRDNPPRGGLRPGDRRRGIRCVGGRAFQVWGWPVDTDLDAALDLRNVAGLGRSGRGAMADGFFDGLLARMRKTSGSPPRNSSTVSRARPSR